MLDTIKTTFVEVSTTGMFRDTTKRGTRPEKGRNPKTTNDQNQITFRIWLSPPTGIYFSDVPKFFASNQCVPQNLVQNPAPFTPKTTSLLADLKAKVNQTKMANQPKPSLQPNGIPKPPLQQQINKLFSAQTSEISIQAKYDQMHRQKQQTPHITSTNPIIKGSNPNQNLPIKFVPAQPSISQVKLVEAFMATGDKTKSSPLVKIIPAAP